MDPDEEYIDRVPNLPPSPTIAIELLELFKETDRDVDRIVQLVSHDPSLTAEVLKRCNSVFHRRGMKVSDMFEAITRVGFYEIYCIVVAMLGSRTMAVAPARGGINAGNLWNHSVKTAVTASTLARRVDEDEAVAFTAGLLHDVGKLILASAEPAAYAQLVRDVGSSGPTLVEQEQALLGATHATVGSRLLERWNLPDEVVRAVTHHHNRPGAASPSTRLAATINLANELAHRLTEAKITALELAAPAQESMSELRIESGDLPKLCQQTTKGLERVQALLGMTV